MRNFRFWIHVAWYVVAGAGLAFWAFTAWGWIDPRYADAVVRWAVEHWKLSIGLWVIAEASGQWLDHGGAGRRSEPPPPGVCPTCGYDLRATPDRCPECGTVPAGAKGSAGAQGRRGAEEAPADDAAA